MARLKIGTNVRIKWEDHWEITGEEMTLDEIKARCNKPYVGKATGFVVYFDRRMLVLASNYWEADKTYDGSIFCIMRKVITEMEVLDA